MKNRYVITFSLACITAFTSVVAQSKHALIFAIGNYPEEKGWISISSLRDAEVINTTLINQKFEDIRIYRDSQVTPTGIANAFRELIDDKNLHEGDVVVIHFSSHGEQVEDDDGDEVDRLDECIVTYNAVSPLKANKKDFQKTQREYFRDDQFGEYIRQLRNKLGRNGDIVVFIDACHSGTGTRGSSKVRGGQLPLVSENFDSTINAVVDIKSKGVFMEKNALHDDGKDLATYLVYSAARSDELDYEAKGKGLGSLSYAIGKVFEKLDAGTTYRSLFAKIQSVMIEVASNQHPVMEGNGSDRELFGGKFIPQKPYVEISNIKGNLAEVKAGLMSGLDIGAKVIVLPSGTNDPYGKIPLASGTVTKAFNYTSIVTLDKNLSNLKPIAGWVFVTEPVYNVIPVNIGFSSVISKGSNAGFSESEIKDIKEQFKDLPGTSFDGEPELLLVKGEIRDSIRIKIASVGYIFNTIKADNSLAEKLKEEIKRYAQYKFLRDIEIKDPAAQVEIKLVPFIKDKADTSKIESKIIHGVYEFSEGDKFALWIKNKGNYPVYVNILDLQPDGIINPIFPNRNAKDQNNNDKSIMPTDLLIGSGASVLFSQYPIRLSPPFGMEILKVFVSTKLIDMEGIADSHGAASRGSLTALTRLVKDSYSVTTRGGGVANLDNTDGSTFNVLFRIKK